MNDNLFYRFFVKCRVGNYFGNISIDTLASSVASFIFLLLAKFSTGKKSINF